MNDVEKYCAKLTRDEEEMDGQSSTCNLSTNILILDHLHMGLTLNSSNFLRMKAR
jgi:hypothetical protein